MTLYKKIFLYMISILVVGFIIVAYTITPAQAAVLDFNNWSTKSITINYTLKYNGNGGSGYMENSKISTDKYKLPSCGFQPPLLMEFDNWEIDGKKFYQGQEVNLCDHQNRMISSNDNSKDYEIEVKANWKFNFPMILIILIIAFIIFIFCLAINKNKNNKNTSGDTAINKSKQNSKNESEHNKENLPENSNKSEIYCWKCGKKIKSTSKYCKFCGSKTTNK